MSKLLCIFLLVASKGQYRSFSLGELTPDLYGRTDLQEVRAGSRQIENMFVWPHGPVQKRAGTYFMAAIAVNPVIPGTPAVPGTPATYKLSIFSELGRVWYIPVGDGVLLTSLSGSAENIGGGVVSLPMIDHGFEVDQVILIRGTTHYNGQFTLLAGTSDNQLRITTGYIAENFDGSEVVTRVISGLQSGGGDMVQDNDGNLYHAHTWHVGLATYITKIALDGTLSYDDFDHDGTWPLNGKTTGDTRDIKLSDDGLYLYLMVNAPSPSPRIYVQKFVVSTGELKWTTFAGTFGGFDMDVDSSGNVYVGGVSNAGTGSGTVSYNSSDGSQLSDYADFAQHNYVVVVDDSLDMLLTSRQATLYFNNIANTQHDTLVLGANLGTDGVIIVDGFIYLIERTAPSNVHKLSWDGSSVTTIATVEGPPEGEGIYVDLYGNIVVVNQKIGVANDDVFWFYDTDLTYLSKIEALPTTLLENWNPAAGGAWRQGNVFFDGELATAGTPAVPATSEPLDIDPTGGTSPTRLIAFVPATASPLVIEAGENYMRFYKDVP